MKNLRFQNLFQMTTQMLLSVALLTTLLSGLSSNKASAQTQSPIADFTISKMSGCAPLMVNFMDKSMNEPRTWEWDVNNDGKTDYYTRNPIHTYTMPGTYSVKLKVSNGFGQNEKTMLGVVMVQPAFNLTVNTEKINVCKGTMVNLEAWGAMTYDWTPGMGMMNTGNKFSFIANSSVTVTVTGSNGSCVQTKNITVNVWSNPQAILTASSPQNMNDGRIMVSAIGGKAPYMYRLNEGTPQMSNQFMGLMAGMYKVYVMDANNCMTMSEINLNDPMMCMMPTQLMASNINRNMATIKWVGVSSAVDYSVYYREIGTMNWWKTSTADNWVTLFDLMPGKNYEVKIQTRCRNGMSEFSSMINFMTMKPLCDVPMVSVDHVTANSSWVNWNPTMTATQGYTVSYRAMGMSGWMNKWVGSMEKMAMLSNLMPNTSYEVKATAMCGMDNMMESPIRMFRTMSGNMPCMPVMNLMAKPMMTEANLMWDKVMGASGYIVWWKKKSDMNWMSMSVSADLTMITATNLMPGMMYDVMVKTMCGDMMSDPMSISFMTMDKMMCETPMIWSDEVMSRSAWVKWNPVMSAVKGYTVYFRSSSSSGSSEWMNKWVGNMEKMVMLNNLMPNTGYEVKVVAMCELGNMAESLPIMFTTRSESNTSCMGVMNLKAQAKENEATIMWDKVMGASGYMIWWKMKDAKDWMSSMATGDVTTSLTVANLLPNMMYDVMVKTNCGGLMSNPMTITFRTMSVVNCETPEFFWVDQIMMTSARIQWIGTKTAGEGFTVYYRPVGTMEWMNTWVQGTQTMVMLGNLMPEMTYEIKIVAMCGKNNIASSPIRMFRTMSDNMRCMSVMNLMARAMMTEANVIWDKVMGASGYMVWWKKKSDMNWMSIPVSGDMNMFTATNLMPGMMYDVMVKTMCGNMISDPMSISFMTLTGKAGLSNNVSSDPIKLEVYPNPNKGIFTVRLETQEKSTTRVILRDMTSKEVWSQTHTYFDENNTVNVEASTLPSGIYFLEIVNASRSHFQKVVVE